MAWFKLDDAGAFHAKVVAAGNEAYGAWARAGQWTSGAGMDGFVPASMALTIAPRRVWDRLVAVGLVDVAEGGWRLHDFLDWNPSAAEVAAKRAARADAGKRGGKASVNAKRAAKQLLEQTPDNGPGKHQRAENPVPVPVPDSPIGESPLPPASVRLETGGAGAFEARESYGEAVRGALGGPWAFPRRGTEVEALAELIGAHATEATTHAERVAWLRRTVAEWVAAKRAEADYQSGWAPTGLLRWLNARSGAGGSTARFGARGVPMQAAVPDAPWSRDDQPELAWVPPTKTGGPTR